MRVQRCAVLLGLNLIAYMTLPLAFARERGPRVEVVCPTAPVPVTMGDHQVLAYELHVTNFDVVPLALKRLEVFVEGHAEPLQRISDEALSALMSEVGSPMGTKTSPTIAPGKQVVLFLWVELPAAQEAPAHLSHRMTFANVPAGEQAQTLESTLEAFPVSVSKDAAPVLSPPFDGGIWLAGNGPGNDSPHRRTIIAIDGHIYSPERFAIDWVKVGPNGDSHNGTASNQNWWAYGELVHAVADGEVTQVVDGIEENTPRVLPKNVTLDNIAGNYVIMRITPNRYVTYAHLQKGSIKVQPHQQVRQGTVVGLVGNTGQATAPHLHFQVTDRDSVLESEGVPFVFRKFTSFGPGSKFELDKHPSNPWTNSIPASNIVVEFGSLQAR